METRYVSSFMKKGDGVGGNDLWKGGVEEYMYVNMLFCWNKDFPETEKKDFPYFCVMWLNKDDSVHVTKQTKCGQQKTYVINRLLYERLIFQVILCTINKFAKSTFGLCFFFSRMHLQTKLAFVIFRTQNVHSVTYRYPKKRNKYIFKICYVW